MCWMYIVGHPIAKPDGNRYDKTNFGEVRNMEEKTVRGELEYNGKNYPFVIENRILTIVQSAFHHNKDFFENEYLGTLKGVTDENKYILLLDCRILSYAFRTLNGKIQIGLHGYILQDTAEDRFDCIEFYSPALYAFYSPRKAWKAKFNDKNDMQGLALTPHDEVMLKIPVTISGENLQCVLGFARHFNLRLEDQYALTIQTGLILDLSTDKSSPDLGKYYLYVRDFLAFISFKRDIPFDNIVLWRREADGKQHKCGKAVIFQVEDIEFKPDAYHSITYDDLGSDSFAALFKETAEQRLLGGYNPYFLPANRNEANTVEKSRWLITAVSFEGEFDKRYKNMKAERDQLFYNTKETLLFAIDKAVQHSTRSINNPQNKYFKSFRHLIECYDTTIKEKFQFCEDHFNSEIEQVKRKYCKFAGVPATTDLAMKYAESRNQSAHGNIAPITQEDVVTFQLLRCFIYLLIMERAEVPCEKRKEIINKLF